MVLQKRQKIVFGWTWEDSKIKLVPTVTLHDAGTQIIYMAEDFAAAIVKMMTLFESSLKHPENVCPHLWWIFQMKINLQW